MPDNKKRYVKTFPISWDTEFKFVEPIVGLKKEHG